MTMFGILLYGTWREAQEGRRGMAGTFASSGKGACFMAVLFWAVCGNLEASLMYGAALIVLGRIFSSTSSRCFHAYEAGASHDQAASVFAGISFIVYGIGAFLLIAALLFVGLQKGPELLGRIHNGNGTAAEASIADRMIGSFDSHLSLVEAELTDEQSLIPE